MRKFFPLNNEVAEWNEHAKIFFTMNKKAISRKVWLLCITLCFFVACEGSGAKVGLPAPPLKLARLGGGIVDITELKGKVVLVNFWASWCRPCVEEMPIFERLHREFEGKPFVVLAVSIDKRLADVDKLASSQNLSLPILLDSAETAARAWGTSGVPETFLVDQEGKLVYKVIGPVEYEEIQPRVKKLLGE